MFAVAGDAAALTEQLHLLTSLFLYGHASFLCPSGSMLLAHTIAFLLQ